MQEQNSVVQQIHNDFFSAGEEALKQAREIISKPLDNSLNLESIASRASRLGFTQCAAVFKVEKAKQEHARAKQFESLVLHYRQRYPLNKFITEDDVMRLCRKWNLLLGNAGYFTGDIPEKNLEQIEDFLVAEDDVPSPWVGDPFPELRISMDRMAATLRGFVHESYGETKYTSKKEVPFKIVAPANQFDTSMLTVRDGYKLEELPQDPIVLQPVKGGYLIVTAWGPEASDEAVVNEINN